MIYERGETYSHWVTIRDKDGTKVDPITVRVSIYDPCNNEVVSSQDMDKDSTGIYYYDHLLSSTASYGQYTTKVETRGAASQRGIIEEEFFVMPWKLEKDIRRKMGLTDDKDISDDDLSHIAWSSYQQALRNLLIHHYKEKPNANPATGVGFDGTNTSFITKSSPLGDITGDGVVSGNSVACTKDIDAWWYDEDGSRQDATVTISDSFSGEITITQTDTSAIPSSNEGVYLEYWTQPEQYDEFMFREAVGYLGAHYVNLRLADREHISVADINANKTIVLKHPTRFYNEYRRIMKQITKPKIGGSD